MSVEALRTRVEPLVRGLFPERHAEVVEQLMELASTYDVSLTEEAITIRREPQHTFIESSYIAPVAVLPGYEYQWPFKMDVDAYVIAPPAGLNDLARP